MANVNEVAGKFSGVLAEYERKPERIRAKLGDGKGVVAVRGRTGYVHIRLEDGSYYGVVFNAIAQLINDTKVIVGYSHGQPDLFQVLEAEQAGGTYPPSGVTAGSYTNANITLDAAGHVVSASNGESISDSIATVLTTNATPTVIASVTTDTGASVCVAGYVVATRTGGDSEDDQYHGFYSVVGFIYNDDGDAHVVNVNAVYGLIDYSPGTSWPGLDWEVTGNVVDLRVTGIVDADITWKFVQSSVLPLTVIG